MAEDMDPVPEWPINIVGFRGMLQFNDRDYSTRGLMTK